MYTKELKEKENNLFEKWKRKRPTLILDGIVDYENYFNNDLKVLYILKEVNGGESWDLREFLKNGGRGQTWNNITRWQFGIETATTNSRNCFEEIGYLDNEKRKKYLAKIAVVNLKKVSGSASSQMSEIFNYANKDKDFLTKQIELYSPNVIICCGTGEIVKRLGLIKSFNKWETTSKQVQYFKNDRLIIIDYFHPQARIGKEKLYNDLIEAYLEIINN